MADVAAESAAQPATREQALAGQVAERLAAQASGKQPTSPPPQGGKESTAPVGPDLSDLPGRLRKRIEGLPPEVQAEAVKVYREEMLPDYTRSKQEVAEERKRNEAKIRLGDTLQQITESDNPEAAEYLMKAVMAARGMKSVANGNGHEANGNGKAVKSLAETLLDSPADSGEFDTRLAEWLDQRLEARITEREERARLARDQQNAAQVERIHADAQALRDGFGDLISDAEFKEIWDEAITAHGAQAFVERSVASILGPKVRGRILSRSTSKSQSPPQAGRPATVPGGAEFAPGRDRPQWEVENRPATAREALQDLLMRKYGLTDAGLRDLRLSGGHRAVPPP